MLTYIGRDVFLLQFVDWSKCLMRAVTLTKVHALSCHPVEPLFTPKLDRFSANEMTYRKIVRLVVFARTRVGDGELKSVHACLIVG